MVMKFRMVKFARIPSYNQLFSGDPTWATLEVGGTWTGRTFYGNKERLSFPPHTEQHGTFTRAKPDSSLFFKTARELQEVSLP